MSKNRYSRAHRGNPRQVAKGLSTGVCAQHNNDARKDTRVGNPLFHASENDIEEYRSAKARTTQAEGGISG